MNRNLFFGFLVLNSITYNSGFVQLKTHGILTNINQVKCFSPTPCHLTILRSSKNNTQVKNMFNDYIYNRVNATLFDKKEKLKKEETEEEKFFAKRHLFGLSDYDFTILRISTYIVITFYCVMHWLIGVINLYSH